MLYLILKLWKRNYKKIQNNMNFFKMNTDRYILNIYKLNKNMILKIFKFKIFNKI